MEGKPEEPGLTWEEARRRLQEYGPNLIWKPSPVSFWSIAKEEITEPMILLLLAVGFFYSLWGKLEDAITIFVIIALLVLVEVYTEFKAKKAIASLEEIAVPTARVKREGQVVEIPAPEVVPGDVLVLTPGTKVMADAKIYRCVDLQVDESPLTGESFPVNKACGEEIYAGSVVLAGEGEGMVFSTGKNTRLGQVAATLGEIKPPRTPLQLAMKSLAGKLVYLAVFFALFITLLGLWRGQDYKTMILTGLSLSFAVIPEELPIIITMILSLGAYTLSRENLLVKRLRAAEALGSTTVILTDKTGTITENRLKVVSVYPEESKREILEKALGALTPYSPFLSVIDRTIQGQALEWGIPFPEGEIIHQRNLGDGRKSKGVIRRKGDEYHLFLSGAPEEIFSLCREVEEGAKGFLAREASQGRRVIGVAHKRLSPEEGEQGFPQAERDLDFVGLISFMDPPREGVKETILQVTRAGIRTLMVTGDYELTARSVAQQVGIEPHQEVLTGEELDRLTEEELQEKVGEISVFARTTPLHKYRLVEALHRRGEVVAVTGDGINDVLALKAADIGIAMGQRGTDVAKEAADAILVDDNFITISRAIFQGRKFFDNLIKGVKYYLSVKAALVMIFLLPVLWGLPLPMAPIQIILLELFMDLAASAGFVAEPEEKDIYTRPPRDPRVNIISSPVLGDILLKGTVLFLAVISVYFYALYKDLPLVQAQTLAFTAWIFGHIVLAFVSRSELEPLYFLGIFTNKVINLWALAAISFLVVAVYTPFLHARFSLAAVNPGQFWGAALTASLMVGLLEVKKVIAWRAKRGYKAP